MFDRARCLHCAGWSIVIRLGVAEQMLSYSLEVLLMIAEVQLGQTRDVDISVLAHTETRWKILHKFGSILLVQWSLRALTLTMTVHLGKLLLLNLEGLEHFLIFFGYALRHIDYTNDPLVVISWLN